MQRIELGQMPHTPHRAWTSGEPGHWRHARVEYGQLASGQWYAARWGKRWTAAWTGLDERQVCDAADAWMRRRGGTWTEAEVASTR